MRGIIFIIKIALVAAMVVAVLWIFETHGWDRKAALLYETLSQGVDTGNSLNELIKYVEANTQKEDTILVLPEGLALNFLTDRKSDNKFYSQIPLYVETFGEKLITDRLEFKKPKYIVITDYDTINYYYSFYGLDYAGEIFEYIRKNYARKAVLENGLVISIYERK